MRINIHAVGTVLTPSLRIYIDNKLAPLARFIKRFDLTGEAEIWVEVARTTKHHKKGNIFMAAADLRLPKKILRAEDKSDDVRVAIDNVKRKLRLEIDKYKTRFTETRRRERNR